MRCLSSETFLTLCAVDDDQREEVMMSWRLQMDDIMEFTKDLIECVNNDTKAGLNRILYGRMIVDRNRLENSFFKIKKRKSEKRKISTDKCQNERWQNI